MFLDLDARVKRSGSVVGEDRNLGLEDNGAGVYSRINVVNRAAGLGRPVLDRLLPGVETRIGGEEGRVNVEDAVGERREEGAFHKAHESGEADKLRSGGAQGLGRFLLCLGGEFRAESPAVDETGGNIGVGRPLENEALRVVGEDQSDFGLEGPGADGVEDRLHVGAGTGTEDAESEHGAGWTIGFEAARLWRIRGVGKWTPSLLRLADQGREAHIAPEMMRTSLLLFTAVLALVLASCQSVPERTAGGGAFDESYLAPRLDSNNPDLGDEDSPAAASYHQWRARD